MTFRYKNCALAGLIFLAGCSEKAEVSNSEVITNYLSKIQELSLENSYLLTEDELLEYDALKKSLEELNSSPVMQRYDQLITQSEELESIVREEGDFDLDSVAVYPGMPPIPNSVPQLGKAYILNKVDLYNHLNNPEFKEAFDQKGVLLEKMFALYD